MKELKTFEFQTVESDDYHLVNDSYRTEFLFTNNIASLKKYLFVEKVKKLEKEAYKYDETVDEDEVQEVFENIFEYCYGIQYAASSMLILNTDTDDWRSLDVDGKEIDDEAIYYQIDPEEEPWLFKKTDDKNDESDKLVKKYHLDDYYWEDEDEDVF